MDREVTVLQALQLGFRKGLRFYGRSSRPEFWKFFLLTWVMVAASVVLTRVPVVGSLLQAVIIIAILCCQYTAIIRRLHDLDRSGKIIAFPYLIALGYFIALIPVHALYPEIATGVMSTIAGCAMVLYLYVLYLCSSEGTQGPNRYGTDPNDASIEQQDFVNPQHMASPELLGDPWRKFKNKVDREKAAQAAATQAAAAAGTEATSSAAPSVEPIKVPTPTGRKSRRQRKTESK